MREPPLYVSDLPLVVACGNEHWGVVYYATAALDYGHGYPQLAPVIEYLARFPALDFVHSEAIADDRFTGGQATVDVIGSPWHKDGLADGTIAPLELARHIWRDVVGYDP